MSYHEMLEKYCSKSLKKITKYVLIPEFKKNHADDTAYKREE